MFIQEIECTLTKLAQYLNQNDDFVWLDSAQGEGVSLLAAKSTRRISFSEKDAPVAMASFLDSVGRGEQTESSDLPFSGGWIGFFSYEAYFFNQLLPLTPSHFPAYPLASFYYFEDFYLADHNAQKIYYVSSRQGVFSLPNELSVFLSGAKLEPSVGDLSKTPFAGPIECLVSAARYARDFSAIQKSLSSGDYFELNYTIPHQTAWRGDPFLLYLKLRQVCPASMMGFLKFPKLCILSASPENFFTVSKNLVFVEPIKGTRGRAPIPEMDQNIKNELVLSPKDRAELLMVTDMLRNDLGRICKPGSVATKALFHPKTFSHYHHLVSQIQGELLTGLGAGTIFEALFPGGSITGAPKIKVMQHIDVLENRPRGVYTGAIGYFSNNGNMQFNIPIRTLTLANNILEFATGGGIVADSNVEGEFEECQIKARGILEALLSA